MGEMEGLFGDPGNKKGGNDMKRRTIAALLACTMVIGTFAGVQQRTEEPGDSRTTVTETTAAETTAAAQTGPKVFNDYMTTDIDTLNSHIYTLSASADVIETNNTSAAVSSVSDRGRKII